RWATAAIGFRMLRAEVGALDWRRPFAELYGLRGVVPRFAGVMVCFLTMRNAALVMLPSLAGTAQTGRFAVSYQLADLAMLIPTVLALSSTFAMARGAASSLPHLRRTMVSMVALLSVVSFPIAALAIALAEPVLALLFGPRLLAAAIPLQLMMLATPLMAVDQVLSQGMVSDQRYSEDLIAIAVGAVAAVALTAVGAMLWGAVGAAAAFLVALLLSLMTRAWLMRDLRLFKVFFRAAWRSAIASLLCCALTWWAAATLLRSVDPRWALLWAVPGLAVYAACLAAAGGARPRSRRRMLDFVRRRN
ncbi:MAG TPA: polysaccharide biosynthesis C-terminal domain-containing protein, partial [Burkholderiaceae bacterium]